MAGKVTGRCIVREVPAHFVVEWFNGSGPNGAVSPFLPGHFGAHTRQAWNEQLASFLRPCLGDLDVDQAVAELAADLDIVAAVEDVGDLGPCSEDPG